MKQKRAPTQSTKQKNTTKSARVQSASAHTVYKDFVIWSSKKKPAWHPIKKMRYVFFRMIGGQTITDAIREIHWSAAEFWHLVDLKRHGPFREEYKRAKILQGRSFSDSVVTIAEGRDRTTRAHKKRMDKLIARALFKIGRTKNSFKGKMIMSQLLADLREHDKIIMSRNKLQIDASKWIAKTANPHEFGESSKLSLGGASGGDGDAQQKPLIIQFVGPDGNVVPI